jgi:hypothetical protein
MGFCFPLNKLAQDPYDVAIWHLLFLLPQWRLTLPPRGGAIGHTEMPIQFKHFLIGDHENLDFFLQAQVLTSLNSMPLPQHDPRVHKHLFHSLVLGCAKEYVRATCVLAPLFLTSTSSNTTSIIFTLHPQLDGFLPLFLEEYELG